MKIALVSQPYYPIAGGVTEHVWHLGMELQRRGHTITVITGGGKGIDDRGLRVIRLGRQVPLALNGAYVHVTVGLRLKSELRAIERRERFDIVHIQSPVDPFLPLFATEAMQAPKIGTFHTYGDNMTLFRLFNGRLHHALQKLHVRIAVSPAAEAFITRSYSDIKFRIIPNGIDPEQFSPTISPIQPTNPTMPTILYVGRMDPRKGARYLLATIPYLEKELKDYRILIVGGGWMRKVYDKLIPLHLQHRVEFAGYVTTADLPKYYRSADIFCSPATGGECFGIVLLEAMASGVPIVASDIEGYRWVVEPGKEGILVPPKSPAHLANALIELAKDPVRRKQMGEMGRAKALTYAWTKVTDRIEGVYREVLKG